MAGDRSDKATSNPVEAIRRFVALDEDGKADPAAQREAWEVLRTIAYHRPSEPADKAIGACLWCADDGPHEQHVVCAGCATMLRRSKPADLDLARVAHRPNEDPVERLNKALGSPDDYANRMRGTSDATNGQLAGCGDPNCKGLDCGSIVCGMRLRPGAVGVATVDECMCSRLYGKNGCPVHDEPPAAKWRKWAEENRDAIKDSDEILAEREADRADECEDVMTSEEYKQAVEEAEKGWAREVAGAVVDGVNAATIAHLIAASYVDGQRREREQRRERAIPQGLTDERIAVIASRAGGYYVGAPATRDEEQAMAIEIQAWRSGR